MGQKKIKKRHLLIVIQLIFFVGFFPILNWYYRKKTKSESYKGVIEDIFRSRSTHWQLTYLIMTDKEIIYKQATNLSGDYAEIGDSIIKPADTLMFVIKKQMVLIESL